jgi:hypothetical protein
MKRKLRLCITKILRRTVVSTGASTWICPVCERETRMLSITETAILLNLDFRFIDDLIASGSIHVIEAVNGKPRVCRSSLLRYLGHDDPLTAG